MKNYSSLMKSENTRKQIASSNVGFVNSSTSNRLLKTTEFQTPFLIGCHMRNR